MKRILIFLVMCLAACSSASSASSSGGDGGAGGTGGVVTTTSSAGGTTTTNSEPPVTISSGPSPKCQGNYAFQPIHAAVDQALVPNLPLIDASGSPIEENGALACRRFVPSSYPFFVDEVDAYWNNSGACSLIPDVVTFVAPADPAWPITATYESDGNNLLVSAIPIGAKSPATMTIGTTITNEGDAFYACERLELEGDARSCAVGCALPDGATAPNARWSKTTNGVPDELPVINLQNLAESPTPEIAAALGTPHYDIRIVVRGHAL